MELRQLRHFAAVAAHGSFSKAAKHLHLTQPALSRQVKSLENELGVALLKRDSNNTTLTASGRIFYEDARQVLGMLDQAVRRVQRQTHDRISVGYLPAVVAGLLPSALAEYQKANGGVPPELFDLMPEEIHARALAGKLDVAILPKGAETEVPGFQWTELACSHLFW